MNSLKKTIWDTLIRPHRRYCYNRKNREMYIVVFGYTILISKSTRVRAEPIKDILKKKK